MASKTAKRKPAATSRPASSRNRNTSVKRASAATPAFAQQSAKLYQIPFNQDDMGEAARQASESMRATAENMMKASNDMMQQFFANAPKAASANGAFPGNEQAFSFAATPAFNFNGANPFEQFTKGLGSNPFEQFTKGFGANPFEQFTKGFGSNPFEQFTKNAGSNSRVANESFDLIRENIEAMVACANIAANMSKQLAAHTVSYSNRSFSQHVELSKQALACRTLNDLFDLSSKYAKTFFDNFFSESIAISELVFQGASDISEPLNERINESAERVNKMMQH